jgi:H+/Cl- antiporter ClcA
MRSRSVDFACAVIVVGLLAGCAGLTTTFLLRSVEHLTYHYTFGSLLQAVSVSSLPRVALGPTIGGGLAGLGWWILRSRTEVAPLAAAVKHRERIRFWPFAFDAALQVLVVGSGASLGREVAPRQLAVALGNVATGWIRRLTERDREILLACAAGAGLGAVYAVPLGGALFTLRIMLKSWHPRAVGAALISSSLAVSVSSFITHDQPNLHWPNPDVSYGLIGYALALAPLALVVGLVFNRLMGWAGQRELPKSWVLIPGIAAAGLFVGVSSHWWPELPGNGRSILNVILGGGMTLETAAIILVLKLAATAAFLRVGARGGLFTPALATGAAAGTLFVLTVNAMAGTHDGVPAIALAGSSGVLAITQNAPLWAAVFVWELARPPLWLSLVFVTAALSTYGLRLVVRRLPLQRA